jgi:hypothetical protein
VLSFLKVLAYDDARNGADEAHSFSLTTRAFKISKPMSLHPADLAVSSPNPVLDCQGLWITWIE